MVEIEIPNGERLHLRYLVLDYNGTLACDGQLLAGVRPRLEALAARVEVHVITADTFGTVRSELAGLPLTLFVLPRGGQDEAKRAYVERLGADAAVCVGNGLNDRAMLKAAALGVVVLQQEGAAVATLLAADVAVPDINAALDLLLKPERLVATLRT